MEFRCQKCDQVVCETDEHGKILLMQEAIDIRRNRHGAFIVCPNQDKGCSMFKVANRMGHYTIECSFLDITHDPDAPGMGQWICYFDPGHNRLDRTQPKHCHLKSGLCLYHNGPLSTKA